MNNQQNKVLGILGGLGPMATAYFYELVIAHTKASCDQEHIDMVISSKSTTPDRTAYILDSTKPDPFAVMESEAKRLVTFGAEVIAIPCNTAHYFYTRLHSVIPIPVLNMVELTAQKVASTGCEKVGILATDGTICTNTYQIACEKSGLQCAVPCPNDQKAIMQVIYGNIKSGDAPDMQLFFNAANNLFAQGCQRLILGCTELSLLKKSGLLDEQYIDSMEVLTESTILACGKTPIGLSWSRV